jgi:hypothetical protein
MKRGRKRKNKDGMREMGQRASDEHPHKNPQDASAEKVLWKQKNKKAMFK